MVQALLVLYFVNSDPLLHRLEQHPDGYKVGSINIGAVMVADDIVLMSHTGPGIQTLISVAEQDVMDRKYLFRETKTKL